MKDREIKSRSGVTGTWLKVYIDFKMPCEGWVTAWEYYSSRSGISYASVWKNIGENSYKAVGNHELVATGPGRHVS